jgi:hypothetical protein
MDEGERWMRESGYLTITEIPRKPCRLAKGAPSEHCRGCSELDSVDLR